MVSINKDYVINFVVVPKDATQLVAYKKNYAKPRRMILDAVKDHIVPHILELDMVKKMQDAILNLYQNATTNMKMILREKLKNTQMNQGKDVTSYLTRVRLFNDDLGVFGDISSDDELVRLVLTKFTKHEVSLFKLSFDETPYQAGIEYGVISPRRNLD